MDLVSLNALRTAEEAVTELIEACRKSGPLYHRHPRVVAQVSRTGKWLLAAVAALRRELDPPAEDDRRGA